MPTVAVSLKCPACGHEFTESVEIGTQPRQAAPDPTPGQSVFKAMDDSRLRTTRCEKKECQQLILYMLPDPS